MNNYCKIWVFQNAPLEYQKLSCHGGDEDWVIFVPNGFDATYIIDRLTICDFEKYSVDTGLVYITAHA